MEPIKRRALGRGLEELFSNEPINYTKIEEKIVNETPKDAIIDIQLTDLRSNPYQPRKKFNEDSLNELADSIKEHGVFQPIIVKKSVKGYEIIAGERRVKASKIAGLTKIPAIIRDFNDQQMMEIALLENLQREDLNAIEEATAYKKIQVSLNITQDELAKRLGKSRSHITNMLGLINLPNDVKELISNKLITMGHARVLSKIEDENTVVSLANRIISEGLSVRDTERLATKETYPKKHNIVNHRPKNEFTYIEESLCDRLGTRVKIKDNKLIINFTNINDFNRLLEIMHLDK